MRRNRSWITWVCCLLATTVCSPAQTTKPGLWELTSTTTWKRPPYPAPTGGSAAGGGGRSALGSGPHTSQFCITQHYFDKYGAILPQIGGCRVTNIVKTPHGMTGDMVCSGKMNGKLSLTASWTDDEHSTGKVQFIGSMEIGPNSKPVEWTTASSSIYKGPDCGSVKPIPMPDQ